MIFLINQWNQILIFNVQKSHLTNPLNGWWASVPPHSSYLSRTPRTMSVEFFCVMWRKFRWEDILDVEKFHMWRNFGCEENLRYAVAWMVFVLFCRKICSVAIYAVLSRHLFCCDLRTFYVRQIKPKICSVEEKITNMMYAPPPNSVLPILNSRQNFIRSGYSNCNFCCQVYFNCQMFTNCQRLNRYNVTLI